VALDVIPGQNTLGTRDDVEKSAQKSFDNLRRMLDAGLDPIPVFHQGEDYEWLVKMIEEGCRYIGISPYLRSHRNEIVKFLDNSFSIVCDAKGRPRVKTHGFGVTTPAFMRRVPWHSTDSTSWNLTAAYGSIKLPQYVNGKPDYTATPVSLSVTGRGPERKDQSGRWAATKDSLYYEHLMRFLEDVGLTITEVCSAYHMRLIATIKYYQHVEAACQNVTFNHRVENRVTEKYWDREAVAPVRKHSYRQQYAVLPTNGVTNGALSACGVTNRLISYLDLKDWNAKRIEDYVAIGRPDVKRTGTPQSWSSRSSYLIKRRLALQRRATAALGDGMISGSNFALYSPDEGNI
jgi:hypothetical protein